ncbi:MAG: hypothetical protein HMLKMBBP_03415 [Planctomycetes bacterium]|nr:hypothetical protein [Planctomycetota bacterium]
MRPVAVLALFAFAASAAAEDVLVLENGREIRGRIVSETDAAVKIDIGGGTMTFKRAQIAEVKRENAGLPEAAGAPVAPDADLTTVREEHAILYREGERAGVRVVRCRKEPDGYLFEEERVWFDAKGAAAREVRSSERCDLHFRPLSFQSRETETKDGKPVHRTLSGEFRSGRLFLLQAVDGDRLKWDEAVPPDPRLPLGARELFLRESTALAGVLDAQVFDPSTRKWTAVSYREGGMKKARVGDKVGDVRVVARKRGSVGETEWVGGDLVAWNSEVEGAAVRAIAAPADAVARLRTGDAERVTGQDSAAKTRYADRERGFSIGKPDPSWTFEKPAARAAAGLASPGGGALLVVRNEPVFATVDVMLDPSARADVTVERAAESLQRACRAVAEDFRVDRDGWIERAGRRVYWMEATATTKGEKTRTLARVTIAPDLKVYRLLAACPESAFAALRPDFEKILDSFAFE